MLQFTTVNAANIPDLPPSALIAIDCGGGVPVLTLAGRVNWTEPEGRPLAYVALGRVADPCAADLTAGFQCL